MDFSDTKIVTCAFLQFFSLYCELFYVFKKKFRCNFYNLNIFLWQKFRRLSLVFSDFYFNFLNCSFLIFEFFLILILTFWIFYRFLFRYSEFSNFYFNIPNLFFSHFCDTIFCKFWIFLAVIFVFWFIRFLFWHSQFLQILI